MARSINGSWKEKHCLVIESFLDELNKVSGRYVLKGETALMECYNLSRFSEDIDLDGTSKNEIFRVVERFCKNHGYTYRIAKDSPTVSRFMIDYGGVNQYGSKPLKIEVSYRKKIIQKSNIKKINGYTVYNLDTLGIMKYQAYLARDKIRDLHDIVFIVNNYYDCLQSSTIVGITNALAEKGLEQFYYIISTQDDELIDKDKLETDFLKAFELLELNGEQIDEYEI
ncbi:MAG: nucleotidyl transferase AbiEii/AbiGii toxin family protein [Eubacterium sp.]|nr:nucleotidyl transferase AbiEii/AbiGii toxin family protein [Eubacterium sp.]